MTRDELLLLLAKLNNEDPEEGHMKADQALLAYINDPVIEEAFNRLTKWYA